MNFMAENKNSIRAKFFKALADPLRLDIIDFIGENEKCVCEIVDRMNLAQPLISRHLRILRESGIITDKKDGTKRIYSLSNSKILEIVKALDKPLLEDLTQKILLEAL
ncbi:MAG: winged helix-turn-helix transcriptional regulator [Asgard group archaeon]|nr:winged helix-turn-helix transcriptional regulator [Asgard group archaeon]